MVNLYDIFEYAPPIIDKDYLNLIIIISDTLRRDFLPCYGNDYVRAHHISRFAEKSLVFDKAYCASFPTVPMRRDVFTGAYTATYTPWAPLTEFEPVLQQVLSERYGYTTMMITDEPHIVENGYYFDRGFDGWIWVRGQEGDRWKTSPKKPPIRTNPSKTRNFERMQRCHFRWREYWRYESDTFPARTATEAIRWLEHNYSAGPFYLYIDFFDPHEPWDPPRWYIDMYADPDFDGDKIDYPFYTYWREIMNEEELKYCRALYAAEVTLVDRWVGRIFEKCEDLGLLDNTVIIFTSDHGFLLGEHGIIGKSLLKRKFSYIPLFEEIAHVPLIVYHPDGKKGRTDAVVQPQDFFPTFIDMIGDKYLACTGLSFKEVVTGGAREHRKFAVSSPYLGGKVIPVTVTEGKWSAVFFSRLTEEQKKILDKSVDGLIKEQSPWERAQDMLFNLEKDPAQKQNIADEHPDVMERLRSELLEYLDEVGTDDNIIDRWRR